MCERWSHTPNCAAALSGEDEQRSQNLSNLVHLRQHRPTPDVPSRSFVPLCAQHAGVPVHKRTKDLEGTSTAIGSRCR
jgi:hypothetical protein